MLKSMAMFILNDIIFKKRIKTFVVAEFDGHCGCFHKLSFYTSLLVEEKLWRELPNFVSYYFAILDFQMFSDKVWIQIGSHKLINKHQWPRWLFLAKRKISQVVDF
jgi:hypothetical protein